MSIDSQASAYTVVACKIHVTNTWQLNAYLRGSLHIVDIDGGLKGCVITLPNVPGPITAADFVTMAQSSRNSNEIMVDVEGDGKYVSLYEYIPTQGYRMDGTRLRELLLPQQLFQYTDFALNHDTVNLQWCWVGVRPPWEESFAYGQVVWYSDSSMYAEVVTLRGGLNRVLINLANSDSWVRLSNDPATLRLSEGVKRFPEFMVRVLE